MSTGFRITLNPCFTSYPHPIPTITSPQPLSDDIHIWRCSIRCNIHETEKPFSPCSRVPSSSLADWQNIQGSGTYCKFHGLIAFPFEPVKEDTIVSSCHGRSTKKLWKHSWVRKRDEFFERGMWEEESLTCYGREKKEIGGHISQWPEAWLQVFFWLVQTLIFRFLVLRGLSCLWDWEHLSSSAW